MMANMLGLHFRGATKVETEYCWALTYIRGLVLMVNQ
jgi:hypothetical protein